jgi:hypothetical protein
VDKGHEVFATGEEGAMSCDVRDTRVTLVDCDVCYILLQSESVTVSRS